MHPGKRRSFPRGDKNVSQPRCPPHAKGQRDGIIAKMACPILRGRFPANESLQGDQTHRPRDTVQKAQNKPARRSAPQGKIARLTPDKIMPTAAQCVPSRRVSQGTARDATAKPR